MNFSSPERICQVIDYLWQADLLRAPNRTNINELFNGFPPYTVDEQDTNKLEVNVNFKEGTVLAQRARDQYSTAFLKSESYFNVRIDSGPLMKRDDWSQFVTKQINRTMKRSWKYTQLVLSKFAGVVLHGVGTQMWPNKYSWCPDYVAIEDFFVPTDTTLDFVNLPYFAIRRITTPGLLAAKTHGKYVDPGWQLDEVRKVLDLYKDLNVNVGAYNWLDSPEKMSELYKQNQTYYASDAAPTVTLWDFYFREDDMAQPSWLKRVLLGATGTVPTATGKFLYDNGRRPAARQLEHLIHCQFGDVNNKPPFMYHSVRSLGFLLYDVVQLMNRLRCRFTQRVFEDLLTWFRAQDPTDKARPNMVMLFDKAFIQDGVSFVKNDERPVVNAALVEQLSANFRQLMSEASSSFTQDIDNGTQRELTATETMARVNQVNALLGSLLNLAYVQETFAYMEICRRFCIQDSQDRDVKRFQALCQEHGIPKKYLNIDLWDITPETTLGNGNRILEMAQAEQLMKVRSLLEPGAQDIVTHKFIQAATDSRTAKQLQPLDGKRTISDSTHDATLSFAAMMAGTPVPPKEGTNHIEQIQVMLNLMNTRIQQIAQTSGMGTPADIQGFQLVAQNLQMQIAKLAEDPSMADQAREYEKALSKLGNMVKAFAQRQQQAMRQAAAQNGNGQPSPEVLSKINADQITAQAKARATDLKTVQQLRQKDAKFRQQLAHDRAKTAAEIQREAVLTGADIQGQRARTAADLHSRAMVGAIDSLDETGQEEGAEA